MTVCLLAPVRNAAAKLAAYFIRVRQFKDLTGWDVRVVLGEGDSTDPTRMNAVILAHDHGVPLDLLQVDHGGPMYGSTEEPERFRQLSMVQNALMNAVRATDDVAVYLEHDVVWEPAMLKALVELTDTYPVIAPMVLAEDRKRFYDVWAFRDPEGLRYPPYFDVEDPNPWEASSMGTCFAMQARVARKAVCLDEMSLVGLCAYIRKRGYTIHVAPHLSLYHPDH